MIQIYLKIFAWYFYSQQFFFFNLKELKLFSYYEQFLACFQVLKYITYTYLKLVLKNEIVILFTITEYTQFYLKFFNCSTLNIIYILIIKILIKLHICII